jgi:hypothetical protein
MNEKAGEQLIGEWISDPTDSESLRKYGKVSMSFKDDGRLVYRIHTSGETKIMLLTYRVQGETLITNQMSSPQEERTVFSITLEGKLMLVYRDNPSYFIRTPAAEISKD